MRRAMFSPEHWAEALYVPPLRRRLFMRSAMAWEKVGAQFVPDVSPYEFMKLRLLNASHLAVSGLGQLAGYVTIDESMADSRIRAIMSALMDRETGPTLPEIPGVN